MAARKDPKKKLRLSWNNSTSTAKSKTSIWEYERITAKSIRISWKSWQDRTPAQIRCNALLTLQLSMPTPFKNRKRRSRALHNKLFSNAKPHLNRKFHKRHSRLNLWWPHPRKPKVSSRLLLWSNKRSPTRQSRSNQVSCTSLSL